MNKNLIAFVVFFLLGVQLSTGQVKKQLSHDDYAGWNTLTNVEISPDGKWVVYQAYPQQGDGNLIIRNLETGTQHTIPRGYRSAISPNGQYLVARIMPQQAVERQARVERRGRNDMPVDSLAVFVFATGQLEKVAGVTSYQLPEEPSDWMVYMIDYARVKTTKQEIVSEAADGMQDPETVEKNESLKNKWLFIYNPVTGQRFHFEDILEYTISPFGTMVAGITEAKKDSLKLQEVRIFDTRSLKHKLVESREGIIRQVKIDRNANQLAWVHTGDTSSHKNYNLYLWEGSRKRITQIVGQDTKGMPEGFTPSENRTPYFSNDGGRLFFGTAPISVAAPRDTLLNDEKYSLDIWHWQDQIIQPQQQVMLRRERNRNYLAVYHIRQGRMVQLSNCDYTNISLDAQNNTLQALGTNSLPYVVESTWTGANSRDLFIEDLNDGSRTLIKEKVESSASLSPGGNFVIWYDHENLAWMAYNIARKTTANITAGIPENLYIEENDLPRFSNPHGIAGWSKADESVLIYDRHDIWRVDPTARRAPERLTQGYARANNLRFRLAEFETKNDFIDLSKPLTIEAFRYCNKQSGFYSLHQGRLRQLVMDDANFFAPLKARDADRMVWRRSTFTEFSDLWAGKSDFSGAEKISDVNPQQAEYLWGSVELVEWRDFDNQTLQGLLYLPEDFDPSKKYPTLVYFYERSSHSLHQHYIPAPSRSTINRSYCTSNGYIVFVPDITYKTGYPGESAYNAIVSGTKAMIERYPFIDPDNIGLQGQSWGGYQIAYLITRTNMFKAAMAGAPVSNMVSAYGGIRWESGRSRQFQYEYTQSRIGGTLWEKPLRYVENSPVFFADKIETPLLMMHNDQDGAVPWYQGIEMFMAMRRLQKPVWMLVYNGEAHNLNRWPNRMDLSVRMYQFFDYYLKGSPPPAWLVNGVSALEKGQVHGYDLIGQ